MNKLGNRTIHHRKRDCLSTTVTTETSVKKVGLLASCKLLFVQSQNYSNSNFSSQKTEYDSHLTAKEQKLKFRPVNHSKSQEKSFVTCQAETKKLSRFYAAFSTVQKMLYCAINYT